MWTVWSVALGMCLFASMVVSQAQSDDPVLHEFVPNTTNDELNSVVSSDGKTPAAIVYDGELLEAPSLDVGLQAHEKPMRAFPGDGKGQESPGRRSQMFRPDRITALEGTLGYYSVFSPTITPFKRVTALDSVEVDASGVPVLVLTKESAARRRPVPIEDGDENGVPRDRFWGNVVLDFRSGSVVPFPSVSPGARILSLQTEPKLPVRIEKDAADNFYAVIDSRAGVMVRVVFLMDAPQRYFGTTIPDVPVDTLAAKVPKLPTAVKNNADRLLSELSLSRKSSLKSALETLTRHFRSFEESSEPPKNTGNILADLTRGMRGICRHRTYSFSILAQALGIPTRFVQNEAHSFVEVALPVGGEVAFMRIDLGGAANGLETHTGDQRPTYQPRFPDPLPRPEAYRRSYSQAAQANRSQVGPANSATGGTGGTEIAEQANNMSPDVELPVPASQNAAQSKGSLNVVLSQSDYEVFRGSALKVSGRARGGDGVAVDSLRIEVLLLSGTGRTRGEQLLGVTVTDDHGHFSDSFAVPSEVLVGDHVLIARSPGDARHNASLR